MTRLPLVLVFVALTFCCWGAYGPVLHEGQHLMGEPLRPSSLRPFICVGLAYFLIAVIVPIAWLKTSGEKGGWTISGAVWSLAAGAAGAIGALGITIAFKSRGNPLYVMPLVFGLAPVVNTFVTMLMTKTMKEAGPIFYAGVIIVALGGAGVMFFKPVAKNIEVDEAKDRGIAVILTEFKDGAETTTRWPAGKDGELQYAKDVETLRDEFPKAFNLYLKKQPLTGNQRVMILISIILTALCWGSYGPVLHKGQLKMSGSRLRPLLCVGLAYFAIAVVIPFILLNGGMDEPGGWNFGGIVWSLAGGAAGAIGALGIIMAFNFGGKPIFVMPLVFGVAPVVNTFITVTSEGTGGQLSVPFFASLVAVIAGAVTVLLFAPKGHKPPPGKDKSDKKKSPRDKTKSIKPEKDETRQSSSDGANSDRESTEKNSKEDSASRESDESSESKEARTEN
jgi:MFS family permease